MQMDINKQPQPRPLSFSSYHSSQAYQSPLPDIKNFINPESEKTPQVIMTHWQRQFYSNQRFHESFKTVMCQNWLERAQCHYGRYCRYAHGLHELRQSTVPLPINSKYKTRLCDKYTNLGICPYGNRCLFIHPEDQQELKNSPNATTEGDEEMPLLPSQPPAPPPNTPLSSRVLEPKQRPLDSPVLPAKAQQRHVPVPLASINASNNPFTNSLPSSLFNMRSYRKQTVFAIPQRTRGRNLLPPEIQEELIREMENITPSATPKQFLDEEQEEPKRASAHQPTGLLRPILPFEASSSKFFSSWTDKDSNNFGASSSTANQSSMFAPLPASSSTNIDNANTQLPSTSSSIGNNKCKWTTDPQQHEMERLVDTLIASPIIAVNSNSNQL